MNWVDVETSLWTYSSACDISPPCIFRKRICLYDNFVVISQAIGGVRNSEEAKRVYFIGAVLFYLVQIIDELDYQTQRTNFRIK